MLDPDISANESISYQNLRSQLRAAENKAEETLKGMFSSEILELISIKYPSKRKIFRKIN